MRIHVRHDVQADVWLGGVFHDGPSAAKSRGHFWKLPSMIADPTFYVLAIPAVIFAGVSKGGFGSGAAFAAAPILALALEPAVALGVMLPLLMVMDVTALRAYWRQWSWRDVQRLSIGAVPGVALGVLVWQAANADILRLLIGLVALGFVAFQLARSNGLIRIRPRPWPAPVGLFTGLAGGFTSFISHAGGPPVAVYLLSQGLSKTVYQATTVATFGIINLLKIGPYSAVGIINKDTLLADLFLIPVAFLGTRLGVVAHRWLSERAFFAITYVLLTLTGSKLIFDAVT